MSDDERFQSADESQLSLGSSSSDSTSTEENPYLEEDENASHSINTWIIITDIFISEVEIAKILMFSSAKDLNILCVTPGLAIIPAPIIDTFASLSSCVILL